MSTVIPVVLSGGSGSRLWPKSRHHYPKQLHRLYGEHTMLQHTILRLTGFGGTPIVICNDEQRFMVADQLRQIDVPAEIILEPVARNTAPAIAVAALRAQAVDPQAVIAVFAADHLIKRQARLDAAVQTAISAAQQNRLVTFGVVPDRPETGYGYLKAQPVDGQAVPVQAFVEKPDRSTAERYLQSGDYYWNSGMFVFPVEQLLREMEKFCPAMLESCRKALDQGTRDLDFFRLDKTAFAQCKDESIDYAVMEKTAEAYMVPLDAQWSDVGDWRALWEVSDRDSQGNALVGDVIAQNSRNCYVNSEGRLVAMVGVDDLIVVETADSVLVAHKDCSQDVKKIVEQLKREKRSEYIAHREVHRPWGSYDLIDTGDRYQVKCIRVRPGASLSFQMHHHRAEHWVVVVGTAEVRKGEEKIVLTENQSIYIPLGEKHRLSNPGKIPLRLVEVASGSYLSEDDIVRFEDDFGRI